MGPRATDMLAVGLQLPAVLEPEPDANAGRRRTNTTHAADARDLTLTSITFSPRRTRRR
jgi:hypothetical protein